MTSTPTDTPPPPLPEEPPQEPTDAPMPTEASMPEVTPVPIVYSISPDCGIPAHTVPIIDLSGDYFQPGATARITNGRSIDLSPVTWVSPNQITGVLDLSTLSITDTGLYDVQVTNPDQQSGSAFSPALLTHVTGTSV